MERLFSDTAWKKPEAVSYIKWLNKAARSLMLTDDQVVFTRGERLIFIPCAELNTYAETYTPVHRI